MSMWPFWVQFTSKYLRVPNPRNVDSKFTTPVKTPPYFPGQSPSSTLVPLPGYTVYSTLPVAQLCFLICPCPVMCMAVTFKVASLIFFFMSVFPFQISLEAKGSFCSPVIYFWLFPYVSAFLTPLSQEQNWRTSLIFCGTTRTSKTASSASFDSLYLLEVLKTESVCDNLLNSWSVSHWVTSFSLAQQCTLIMEASGGHVPGWLTPLCPYESDWA